MKHVRGMTLIEAMVSVALMSIALAAMGGLVANTTRLAKNAERTGDTQDAARTAGELLMNDLRRAGAGAPGGVWVGVGSAGALTPVLTSPIFGTDGTGYNGSDDIWMLLPDKNAFGETCASPGAGTAVAVNHVTGPLTLVCTNTFQPGDYLLGSNTKTGVLMTNVSVTTPSTAAAPGVITYAEQSMPLLVDVLQQGFTAGDLVYRVSVVRYFIAPNPVNGNRPALYRQLAQPGSSAATPLVAVDPSVAPPMVVQDNIEDLQLKYGIDKNLDNNPDNYVYQDGFGQTTPDAGLRTIRVSVVGISSNPMKNDRQQAMTSSSAYAPFPVVENHDAGVMDGGDGYQRVLFQRSVDLGNLATGQL